MSHDCMTLVSGISKVPKASEDYGISGEVAISSWRHRSPYERIECRRTLGMRATDETVNKISSPLVEIDVAPWHLPIALILNTPPEDAG